ncbi:MAG: 50S ribosomal protein L25 [Rhodothermia bacterium]
MKSILLHVESRGLGKRAVKSVRNSGSVPCVLYGPKMEPVHFQVAELSLHPLIFTHETHIVEVSLDGDTWSCILRDINFHPVSDRPIHVDFQLLTEGQTIRVTIPVQLMGTPAGQLEGGVTQQVVSEIEIECLPKDIPGHLELDISALNIGDTLHVSDLDVENVTVLTSLEHTVVTVAGAAPEEEILEEELEEGLEGEDLAEGVERSGIGEGASDGESAEAEKA